MRIRDAEPSACVSCIAHYGICVSYGALMAIQHRLARAYQALVEYFPRVFLALLGGDRCASSHRPSPSVNFGEDIVMICRI